MALFNGWKVDKSNADTERFHLNKVLADIRASIDTLTSELQNTGAGGVLPVVTGEITSGQPVFVIAEDSSLIYLPVES